MVGELGLDEDQVLLPLSNAASHVGLTLEFLSYEILEIFMQNEFRISRKNALCFTKFRVSRNLL